MTAAASTPSQPHTSTPASRLWIGIGFLATTLITSAAGYFSASWQAERQAIRTEQISEIDRFLKTTEQFEPLMRAHMLNIVHQRDLTDSREALVKNIQEQHVVLDTVRAYVPIGSRGDADHYADVLVDTADALEAAKSPLTAGPLMQQVNNAVITKRKVAADLRHGVGLPE